MKSFDLLDQIVGVLENLTSTVPASPEAVNVTPAARAHDITMAAASKSAAVAGALALPPGPLGMLTVIPDLIAVWHIQRQLVADIAACYGKTAELGSEAMVYCLFRHAVAQVVRDFAVRVGERMVLRRLPATLMARSLRRVGLAVSQRAIGRGLSRWVPIAGAVGVGAYAFYDTVQVGKTARALFEQDTIAAPAETASAPA
jgi:hypothetical protein